MTSKLTREWLQHQISAIEAVGITDSNTLAAFKMALAAMDSEPAAPVAEVVSIYGDPEAFGEREIRPLVDIQQMPYGTKLYRHAQTAPDEAQSREAFEKWCQVNIERNKWHPEFYAHLPAREQWAAWEACRAAMLHDAEPVTKECRLPEDFDFDHFNDPVWFEAIIGLDNMYDPVTRTLATVALELNRKLDKPELTVWYGSMPETNGKTNWTAILHRKGECLSTGITVDRSEYPDRVRHEADRMRHLIGDLADEPDILAYDTDAHSGYVPPAAPQSPGSEPAAVPGKWIPVSERMPDENAEQQVLACFKGGDISTLYYFEGRWDDAYGIVPIRQDVTHWMPLPAAPQEAINVLIPLVSRNEREVK